MDATVRQGMVNQQRRRWLCVAASVCGFGGGLQGGAVLAQSRPNPVPAPAPAAQKPELRQLSLAIANPGSLPYLPVWVALHKGFFSQQGLDVQILDVPSAGRAIQALSSSQADLVGIWLENAFSAAARNLGLQCVVQMGVAPMMSVGLSSRLASAPPAQKGLGQLRGRKIGVLALNSPTHTVAHAVLRQAGLRSTEAGLVSVGSASGAQAALRSGQIDALVYMDPLMVQLEQRGEIIALANLHSPAQVQALLGRQMPSSCIAASSGFLQRYPATAQAVSDAMVQALQWITQANLRDVLRVHADSDPSMDAQSFVASFERLRDAYSGDGLCRVEAAADLLAALHDLEPALRLESIDAGRVVNSGFVTRSLQRLRVG
jgi:NitT/TauT family transport system substrate-binding protein